MADACTLKDRLAALRSRSVASWSDVNALLDELSASPPAEVAVGSGPWEPLARGIAFVTFAYDIDGVSIEIAKYARCLEQLFSARGRELPIHCIGGNFAPKADFVLDDHWNRVLLPNADGWDKWDDGKWFAPLFYEDMPDGGAVSNSMAGELWSQALTLTEQLCHHITEHNLGLLFVVNVNSNPGNPALALATVLASELAGCPVLNNSHDYYWEGGAPASQRGTEGAPGPRDHFFRNQDNAPFWSLFTRLLPWNGRRWIQVNINPPQSTALMDEFGFTPDRVFEIGTLIDDAFLEPCSIEEKRDHRRRMAHILSDGEPTVRTFGVQKHLETLAEWMSHQQPLVCGAEDDLVLDPAAPNAIYLLQPTRVVARKRIERDWQLIGAWLAYPPFLEVFQATEDMTLTLHITGPVPIEHQADLERVLHAYGAVLDGLPVALRRRVFLAFSVGNEDHPSLHENGLGKLDITSIYKLADLVVFPSLTEGRGLPIVESAAAGIPIVCSRYEPEDVFAAVVGEHLGEAERILYDLFPDAPYPESLFQQLTEMVLDSDSLAPRIAHNRDAVRSRFSLPALQRFFGELLQNLSQ